MIVLVRHGSTKQNELGIIQGRSDNHLSTKGIEECKALRDKLKDIKFDICFVSPLTRTKETANIIAPNIHTIEDKRIIEREMGELEDKPRNNYYMNKYWDYDLNCHDLGVEDLQSIFKRCTSFLNYIKKEYPHKNILVVTHGAPFRAMYDILNKVPINSNLETLNIYNCFYTKIDN